MESNDVKKFQLVRNDKTYLIDKDINMFKFTKGDEIIVKEPLLIYIWNYNMRLIMKRANYYLKFIEITPIKWYSPNTWQKKYIFKVVSYGW